MRLLAEAGTAAKPTRATIADAMMNLGVMFRLLDVRLVPRVGDGVRFMRAHSNAR
jgi:hypothetical protein